MDADTRLYLEQLNERIVRIEGKIDLLHAPANCALSERVRALELTGAHQKGVIAVIGAIAGLVASILIMAVSQLFRKG